LHFRTIHLGRENEIAFRQSVNLVGPDNELDLAPGEMDIRMMPLGLGQFSDPVGKSKRRAKILEAVLLFQLMPGHHLPVIAKFLLKLRQFRSLERGDPPLQGTHSFSASSAMGTPLFLPDLQLLSLLFHRGRFS